LREDILLVSLLFLSISEGLIEIMMIDIKRAKIAMTIRSSMRVKLLLFSFDLRNSMIYFILTKNPPL